MRVLDLFSGIGGFSLGLERAGMTTVAFCEIEPYCRKVLAKHWPNVPIYGDIRELTAERLRADGISVDLICGGFPCQDISVAGKGAGLAGERSGLWSEYARLVGELRPQYVIVENVSALLGRGLGRVLGDLAALGYDAEWHCIPASYVGAPHRRDRLWIVAYPDDDGREVGARSESGDLHGLNGEAEKTTGERKDGHPRTLTNGAHGDVAYTKGLQRDGGELHGEHAESEVPESGNSSCSPDVADAGGSMAQRAHARAHEEQARNDDSGTVSFGNGSLVSNAVSERQQGSGEPFQRLNKAACALGEAIDAFYGCFRDQWSVEPDVGRVADGVPARVDRLKSLGNAVVPQIPELIGRAILRQP